MIYESRLRPNNDTPTTYQAGPEWTDTECYEIATWLDAASDNGIQLTQLTDGELTVYDCPSDAVIYSYPDSELDNVTHYTATIWR
jgi:hypothetical protein